MLLLDLFFAGMETTVTTLKWGFLLSIIHPEVQAKVQNELDEIGRRITLADKPKCSYTVATINVNFISFHLYISSYSEGIESAIAWKQI